MSRIVIDARESGTSTGRYVDKMIEYMHKLQPKHDITLLAKAHRLEFYNTLAPNFTVIETPFAEFSFGEQIGFKKQLESLHPDLVHFPMVQQPVWYRGRVVTTMQDLTTIRFRNPSKNPIIFTVKQMVYKWVNKKAAHKSRLVLTPTEFVRQDVINFTHISPDKVVVTYEAADAITAPAAPVNALVNKQFIMYVGRPMPHKNLGRLIEAFSLLQQDFPDLHLVLAGKKDVLYEAHAKNVQAKGIKNVVFTDFISDGELRWLYEHTACYVFPSLSEGFGLPPLEAMTHGAPVAASNATCIPEVLGDAAAYFDPTDSGAVAGVVRDIINNKAMADELRAKGSQQAAKYSWERMSQQTLGIYDQALSP